MHAYHVLKIDFLTYEISTHVVAYRQVLDNNQTFQTVLHSSINISCARYKLDTEIADHTV